VTNWRVKALETVEQVIDGEVVMMSAMAVMGAEFIELRGEAMPLKRKACAVRETRNFLEQE